MYSKQGKMFICHKNNMFFQDLAEFVRVRDENCMYIVVRAQLVF